MTLIADFQHNHFAHCESGVMSAMLQHNGLPLSEAMVFGLSGALCFAYLPFIKMNGLPVVSYRMPPGQIVKKLPPQLGMAYAYKTFKNHDHAMAELDEALIQHRPVGLQTSAYYTTYFPPEMRFHFNAHNIIVIGRQNGEYLISDPVFDHIVRIKTADLRKARFAKGLFAPKGLAHYPLSPPRRVDLQRMIPKAILKTARMMLYAPLPWIGIKGIYRLARAVEQFAQNQQQRRYRLFLGHVVRMQEEIGTGGGGFRFLYASFLQEAYDHTGLNVLAEAAPLMTDAGDTWRQFAWACAQVIKRKNGAVDANQIADLLRACAEKEKSIYRMLKKAV